MPRSGGAVRSRNRLLFTTPALCATPPKIGGEFFVGNHVNILAFDVSSGGVSATIFDSDLQPVSTLEREWRLVMNEDGAATLTTDIIVQRFKEVASGLNLPKTLDAIVMSCFMHNCVLLDERDQPLTPVFTWLDRRGEQGMEFVRSRLGDRFHERTGCRYHPMFPIFKLATLHLHESELMRRVRRVVSAKALLLHRLTGVWIDDFGMASCSGVFNIESEDWDSSLLSLIGLQKACFPQISNRQQIVGNITSAASAEFGLPAGVKVVNGSGDGFLANVGSGCESPNRFTITLGTSASARQILPRAFVDNSSGTFCYLADKATYLVGCASSNGGNVLDWARSMFGPIPPCVPSAGVPIFIPFLHGERSPEWDSRLTGSWHGLTAGHTSADLAWSVLEGVLFNVAQYVDILEDAPDERAEEVVLSGNGFLQTQAPHLLAAILNAKVLLPRSPGLASLRGAAICALRALGAVVPPLDASAVAPSGDSKIGDRFHRYKQLRAMAGSGYLQTL